MGRVHVLLAELAPGGDDLAKATALAERMQAVITVRGDGACLSNHWGGAFSGDGEGVSHAAIDVDFATHSAADEVGFDRILGSCATSKRVREQLEGRNDGVHPEFAANGEPARAIQALAGHASIITTERYMHLAPAAARDAIDGLNRPPSWRHAGNASSGVLERQLSHMLNIQRSPPRSSRPP
jgi:hypothetical protein